MMPITDDTNTYQDGLSNLLGQAWELHAQAGREPRLDTIEELVRVGRVCLSFYSIGRPENLAWSKTILASGLFARCELLDGYEDIDEAVEMFRQALSAALTLDDKPLASVVRGGLGKCLAWRFRRDLNVDELVESKDYLCTAIETTPQQDPDRHNLLYYMADIAWTLFMRGKVSFDFLRRAMDFSLEALHLRDGRPEKHHSFQISGSIAFVLYEETGAISMLLDAIRYQRSALALRPPGHPMRARQLNALMQCLLKLYRTNCAVEHLNEAISLGPEALSSTKNHPIRHLVCTNFGSVLNERFRLTGSRSDVENAIKMARQALFLTQPGHPRRYVSLNCLGLRLEERFQEFGDLDDLEEAIVDFREALEIATAGHSAHGVLLMNLVEALSQRHRATGSLWDLNEAILCYQRWFESGKQSHHAHGGFMCMAARALVLRYKAGGQLDDLNYALQMFTQALNHIGPYSRAETLHEVAEALRIKVAVASKVEDLHEAMLTESRALEELPTGHSARSNILLGLAQLHLIPNSHYFDPNIAIKCTLEAINYPSSSAQLRLKESVGVLAKMSSMHAFTDRTRRSQLLELHRVAMTLLPQVAYFGLELQSRLRVLRSAEHLAPQAAALANELQQPCTAVELLEQGRAVFWSQSLRLRTQFTDLPDDLAQNLYTASRELERASSRNNVASSDDHSAKTAREEAISQQRQLADRFEVLIAQARGLPGFGRFMLHDTYDSLARVAERGPVVILLTGLSKPAAIIIRTPFAKGETVPLPNASLEHLNTSVSALKLAQTHVRNATGSRAMIRVHGHGRKDETMDVLASLWKNVMEPIMDALHSSLVTEDTSRRSRVWLCPTGTFTHLPLHAAGIYRSSLADSCSDRAIVSYTPTLTALLNARARLVKLRTADAKVLLAAAPKPFKWSALPFAVDEVNLVREIIPSSAVISLVGVNTSENVDVSAQVETVLEKLPDASILHLACHGHQDAKNPLNSGFIMNKMLTLSKLMSLDLPNAFLAFLSACETAKSDETQPDEAIHLAATMLFAGFKSVIGTMWSMGDADGPLVAMKVYSTLFASGAEYLDPDDVPRALDAAVAELREKGLHANRWGPYVHIGV